ncbi:MAG: (2Fe-2S)-binding protein, partial [Synergistaceae bacterium]|nr:(2Fe-2S)-binding protein [Synergistaceae bacterium]
IKSPGLTAAPAIAGMALELLRECGLTAKPKERRVIPRPKRFSEMDAGEKKSLLARDPSYGRVICRCETITEGEIRAALNSSQIPPRSLDGVKRRCGTGMGRCQGGFCGPRVLELLAEHYRVKLDGVPQDRADMYILTGETKAGAA